MGHLRDAEFIDCLDDQLSPSRRAHVESCEQCRAEVERLRSAIACASDDPAPAPSPLFWDHFSARVSEAIRREPVVPVRKPSGLEWLRHPGLVWASGLVVVVVVASWHARLSAPISPGPRTASMTAAVQPGDLTPVVEPGDSTGQDIDDAAWSVVQSAADGLGWDEANAAGISVRPDAVERAALELSPDERAELVRLLEDELRRSGA